MQEPQIPGAVSDAPPVLGRWATSGLAPAVELACACCMWPASDGRSQRVRAAAGRVEWPKFLRVVARQRIAGLAQASLKAAGVDAGSAEARAALQSKRRSRSRRAA